MSQNPPPPGLAPAAGVCVCLWLLGWYRCCRVPRIAAGCALLECVQKSHALTGAGFPPSKCQRLGLPVCPPLCGEPIS